MIVVIKPTYLCNYRCRYCYLSNNTKSIQDILDIQFAKNIISQIKCIVKSSNQKQLTIIWHGGEPLLWGIENYRNILSFMEIELSEVNYKNSIQTNLSLINEEYIDLFLQYNVNVGFSLDGTKEMNDLQRIDEVGEGTFDNIMEKLTLCQNAGLVVGCIVVGSKKHIGNIPKLYEFLCENNLSFRFNPLFNSGEAQNNIDEYGITPNEYAKMMIELFDIWYLSIDHSIQESNLLEITSNIVSRRATHCLFRKNCQDNFFAISPTGDVMPCGRFCDATLTQYAYGNLHKETLAEILPRIKQSETYKRSEYIENSSCKQCKYYDICHGGCLHDGFLKSGDFKSKTFLCSAYKKIFAHIETRLNETVKQLS